MSSDSDSEEVNMHLFAYLNVLNVAACAYLQKKIKNFEKKREWVKKWKLRRTSKGSFHLLQQELRLEDIHSYRRYLRMNEDCFNELLEYIKPQFLKHYTYMRPDISPAEALSCMLRFLSSGESYRSMEFQTRISLAYISERVPEICSHIYENLRDQFLKFPASRQDWIKIAENFDSHWHFPLCIGALDGKRVAFRASKADGAHFYNYKGFNSFVLLAMCDADYKFTFVDIGCNGHISDGGALNRTDLRNVLLDADSYLPEDKVIGDNRILPYVIVGDDAFPLEKHLMKPYPYNSTEELKRNFNFRLSHARQTIEHAFGILSNRFRILQSNIHLRPHMVIKIIQARCVLHNFLVAKSLNYIGPNSEGSSTPHNNNDKDNRCENPRRYSNEAGNLRQKFAGYFTKEGKMFHTEN